MRHFSVELEQLHQKLLEMGGMVESALHRSVRSLVDRDAAQANQVIQDEDRINAAEMEIDRLGTRLLLLNQPVARDLRFITAALKITTDLERMGDLSVNIARRSLALMSEPAVKPLIDIPRMAGLVENMVLKCLDAFVKHDSDIAKSVLVSDDEVDQLRDSIYQELVEFMQRDPSTVGRGVNLIFVARDLERIADHATNIAEDVVYLVKGVEVRHRALAE